MALLIDTINFQQHFFHVYNFAIIAFHSFLSIIAGTHFSICGAIYGKKRKEIRKDAPRTFDELYFSINANRQPIIDVAVPRQWRKCREPSFPRRFRESNGKPKHRTERSGLRISRLVRIRLGGNRSNPPDNPLEWHAMSWNRDPSTSGTVSPFSTALTGV